MVEKTEWAEWPTSDSMTDELMNGSSNMDVVGCDPASGMKVWRKGGQYLEVRVMSLGNKGLAEHLSSV